jgi:hypothetical protein
MNKISINRIREDAAWLRTPDAIAARGHLMLCLETAFLVLDVFADGNAHDYEEVAELTGRNKQTCRQILHALNEGGYGFVFSPSQGYKPTERGGRPLVNVRMARRELTSRGAKP